MGDIWRLLHPLQKDYTHYFSPYSVHTRIDYFLIQKEHCYRVTDCRIGVCVGVSAHNAIYLTVQIETRKKKNNTVWQLNLGRLNNKLVVNEIKLDILTFIKENDNGEVNPLM